MHTLLNMVDMATSERSTKRKRSDSSQPERSLRRQTSPCQSATPFFKTMNSLAHKYSDLALDEPTKSSTPIPMDVDMSTDACPSRGLAKIDPSRLGFFDLPGELRNEIYKQCKSHFVDVLMSPVHKPDIHPILDRELTDFYRSENVFVLSAHHKYQDNGTAYVSAFKTWSSQFNSRQAGMIQHLRIVTRAFTAQVHIPLANKNGEKAITTTFDRLKYEKSSDLLQRIANYQARLTHLNSHLNGRRLTVADLNALVEGIFDVVPFCCHSAAEAEEFYSEDSLFSDPHKGICLHKLHWRSSRWESCSGD